MAYAGPPPPGAAPGPQPIVGYKIGPPAAAPRPGDVIIGWEVVADQEGCSCDLNEIGLVSLIILILVFWPLFWIPLVAQDCRNKRQRPIYGPPGSAPHQVAINMHMPTAAVAPGRAALPQPHMTHAVVGTPVAQPAAGPEGGYSGYPVAQQPFQPPKA